MLDDRRVDHVSHAACSSAVGSCWEQHSIGNATAMVVPLGWCDHPAPRHQRAPWRRDQPRGQKRGEGIGYAGHKHEKGEKVIAMTDNHGYVLAPLPVAPVKETDMVLLPEGLHALKQVATEVGLELRGA